MNASPTPAERIAMKTAWAALHNATSPNSEMVETIVYGLGSAGLLMDPEAAAEVARLTALVAAMHAAAVGETKTPLLGLVEDVTLTRGAYEAQQHRADTLNRIARERRAEVARLTARVAELDEWKRRVTEEVEELEKGAQGDPNTPSVAHLMIGLLRHAMGGEA